MRGSSATPWLVINRPNPQARLRLFCFPYAGGGAATYHAWPGELPTEVEVCAVQLPGRASRSRESPYDRLKQLVEALAPAVLPYLDRPYAFFGHSMGALIAFELTRRLRREADTSPAHLFVSGRRAPQLPRTNPPIHDLPEAEFVQALRRLNGTPDEVLAHPELMELMLPLLRADFAAVGTYEYTPEPALACPITAYGGLQDHEVSRAQLEAWRTQTTGGFTLRMLPGDHFYLQTGRALLLRSLFRELHELLLTTT
ncbi:MAG: putative thioesterase [Acidobacteria bacterium]|nr:MAG: putative thioesterase [Acidobacteriota bacterium]